METDFDPKFIQDLMKAYASNGWVSTAANPSPPKKKRGRPRKNEEVVSGHDSAQIIVVANGYQVVVGAGTNADVFVFNDLDAVSKWLKDNLMPKYKNQEFIKAL